MRMSAVALLVVVGSAVPLVFAGDERKSDLAARCEAVTWAEPAGDHLPPELRAIAKELTARGPEAINEIEEALPRSVNLRRTAPDALYHWPSDRTRGLLLAQLRDPDEKAAHHAAWALGLVGGAEVVPPLLAAASRQDSLVVEQALFALQGLGATNKAWELIASAASSDKSYIRRRAFAALEHFDREDRLDAAIALAAEAALSDADARVKEAAARTERILRSRK
ncbi:MAG: HEAT repeat domain-containing protein [Planctomycetes bacterium]|nr:HEAT repeat domain-containing protein [Planctomycetota bacterium]